MNPMAQQLEAIAGARHACSATAHLLHALNQPITGLQCALELAVARPRSNEEYLRTLSEGLELTARIRTLVEALGTVADLQSQKQENRSIVQLRNLLEDVAAELLPVAESRHVRLFVVTEGPVAVRGCEAAFTKLLFRLIESALNLAERGEDLKVLAARDAERIRISVSWTEESAADPISCHQNLGLLVAQAEWEAAGAAWNLSRCDKTRNCTILLPLSSLSSSPQRLAETEK
jgi:signal transduction histidine kinase